MDGTLFHDGLSDGEVAASRQKYGSNEFAMPQQRSLWQQWLDKFRDPTIVVLCVCAGIAVLLGLLDGTMPWDGVAILVAVAIASLGSTWSEFKANKAFELLKRDSEKVPVKVRRNGEFHSIPSTEVVVGDIVMLESGDRVPADGQIVESIDACFDESLMTGESEAVSRSAGEKILGGVTGGTYLVSGSATICIEKVGDSSALGVLARSLHATGEEPQTPLQRRLAGLAGKISVWGTTCAIMIFVALVVCQVVSVCRNSAQPWSEMLVSASVWPLCLFSALGCAGLLVLSAERKSLWLGVWLTSLVAAVGVVWGVGAETLAALRTAMQFFMVAVTIVVVAVPEGLPLAMVVALGLGMRKIREDNNLVRKMVATETIGSATVICSDKTGTLTQNRMSMTEVVPMPGLADVEFWRLFELSCALNSTAELERRDGRERCFGNPTECALLLGLRDRHVDYRRLRNGNPVLGRIPFSADRKMMSTLVRDGSRDILLVKGAPEQLFKRCAGAPDEAQAAVQRMARSAVRPLALAYAVLSPGSEALTAEKERDLTLLAIVGLSDPVRKDVPEAVRKCREAGVDVKMVTGDHRLTAHAIAERAGLWKDGDKELSDDVFSRMSDDEVLEIMPRLRILSRAKPNSKLRLVKLLQRRGEVVAMTGDGTNDAPALRQADVGISMGLRGTDIAKQASDIVLTDDNFGSIVKAVHWGRTLYENLQKFVQFQLTVNLSALGIAFFSPVVSMLFPEAGFRIQPLTVLQYLWINLIMDTLAAIAFGLEPPRPETLAMPPKKSDEPFLTKTMMMNIVCLGLYFVALILVIEAFDVLGLRQYAGDADSRRFAMMEASVVFNCYVWFQIFHMFNARSVRSGESAFGNITRSRSFFLLMGIVAVVQFCMIQFGGTMLNTVALPFAVWVKILLLGATAVVAGEVVRFVQRKLFTASSQERS